MRFFSLPNTATIAAERLSGLKRSKRFSSHGRKRKRRGKSPTLHPSLILLNANIITMDASHPTAEALAVLRDRIIDVGDSERIMELAGPKTKTIDLHGKTILPGLIDCHNHLVEFDLSLKTLDLRGAQSIHELKDRIRVGASEYNDWITGRGWDQENLWCLFSLTS